MDKFPDRAIALDSVVQWIVAHERREIDPVDTLKDLVVDFARQSAFAPRSTMLTANGAFEVLEAYLEDTNLAHSAVAAMMTEDETTTASSDTDAGDDVPGVELAVLVDAVVKVKHPPRESMDKIWFETLHLVVAIVPHEAFVRTAFGRKVTRVYPDITARSIIGSASDTELSELYLAAGVALALVPYLLSEPRDS